MQDKTVPQTTTDNDEQRWYFTFGAGHEHDGRYVEIAGRYDEARAVMIRHFGTAWCAQYAAWESSKVSGFPQGLVELLPETEWLKPDYWLTLADDLRQAADRVATLAGTPAPVRVELDILGSYPQAADKASAQIVDAIAAAMGVEAYVSDGGTVQRYGAGARVGNLHVDAHTYLPLEASELERLRARVAELEAERAAGSSR